MVRGVRAHALPGHVWLARPWFGAVLEGGLTVPAQVISQTPAVAYPRLVHLVLVP
jgi:hypothetical protein